MKVDIVYEFRTGGTIYILDLFITERKEGVYTKRLKNSLWEDLPGNKKTLQVHNSLPF